MISENLCFKGTDGKTMVCGVIRMPDDKHVTQVLHIIHGMTEHMGRYMHMSEYFTQRGYAVCMIDLVGHGASLYNDQKTLNIRTWTDWVDDTETFRRIVKQKFPNIPYNMLGFSLGSFILRAHQQFYPKTADRIILVGTGEPDKTNLSFARWILKLCCWKKEVPSKLVKKLAFDSYNDRLTPQGTEDAEWLIGDPSLRTAYLKDKDNHFQMSARFFDQFLCCMLEVERKEPFVRVNYKVLLLSGSDDPVSDIRGGGLVSVEDAYKKAGAKVQVEIIKNFRHDVLHDKCAEEVFAKIAEFCNIPLTK